MKKQILFLALTAILCLSAVPNTTFACGTQGMDRACCPEGQSCPVPVATPSPTPAPNQSSDSVVSVKAEAVIVPKSRWFFEYFFDLFR